MGCLVDVFSCSWVVGSAFVLCCLFLWFLYGLCLGCGLLFLVCVVLLAGFCFGLMPLSYVFKGGAVRFSFFLVAFGFLYCSWLFVGLCPFGNKFLLMQKKKKKTY